MFSLKTKESQSRMERRKLHSTQCCTYIKLAKVAVSTVVICTFELGRIIDTKENAQTGHRWSAIVVQPVRNGQTCRPANPGRHRNWSKWFLHSTGSFRPELLRFRQVYLCGGGVTRLGTICSSCPKLWTKGSRIRCGLLRQVDASNV